MKTLISFIIGVFVFYLLIVKVDGAIVDLIVSALPQSAADWKPLLSIILWIILVFFTFGIAFVISYFAGILVRIFLGK